MVMVFQLISVKHRNISNWLLIDDLQFPNIITEFAF
jgi:hypothetical protein